MNNIIIHAYFIPTRALLLSACALTVLFLARKAPASKRHVFAVAALGGLMILPFIGRYLPGVQFDLPSTTKPAITAIAKESLIAPPVTDYGAVQVPKLPAVRPDPSTVFPPGPAVEFYLWLAVSCLLLLRLTLGLGILARWVKKGVPMEPGVLRSPRVKVPLTAWIGRPLILLPEDALEWSPDRLQRVLNHERAHIERKDWLWNLLGQVACALYWPLPTSWLLQRAAKRAAEQSCDDRVLIKGASPSTYADDLLSAAKNFDSPALVMALPLITKGELVSRIRHILDPKAKRGPVGIVALAASVVGVFALCSVLAGTRFRANQEGISRYGGIHYQVPGVQYQQFPPASHISVTPGSKETGFVGQLDSTRVTLVQIQHFTGKRTQAWTPDGEPIENPTVYGPAPCNAVRGRFALVWHIDGNLPFPDALRGTVNYYDEKDFREKPDFDYVPESKSGSFVTFVGITPAGVYTGENNSNISGIKFDPTDLPVKSEMWLSVNGFRSGSCSLEFEVPRNSILASVTAVGKSGVRYPAGDMQRDSENSLKVKLFFTIKGSEVDHFDVDVEPMRRPLKFTGINKDAILAQGKEEGE